SVIGALVRAEGVLVSGRPIGDLDLTVEAGAPLGQSIKAHGLLFGGQAELDAAFVKGALKATVDLRELDLTPFMAQVASSKLPVTGTVSGHLTVEAPEATAEALRGQLKIDKFEGRTGETPFHLASTPALVRLEPGLRASTERIEVDLGGGDHL